MMDVKKTLEGNALTVALTGRLDTTTAPQLEAEVGNLDEVDSLLFDFADLEYISSAGLRVLLGCQKQMSRKGGMVIKNVNDTIMEVFEITGFADILTVE